MIISLANLIVDHDATAVAMRTKDTMRYVQAAWDKSHEEPIDAAELHKFLCDEHYGNLSEEQKAFTRQHLSLIHILCRPKPSSGMSGKAN